MTTKDDDDDDSASVKKDDSNHRTQGINDVISVDERRNSRPSTSLSQDELIAEQYLRPGKVSMQVPKIKNGATTFQVLKFCNNYWL